MIADWTSSEFQFSLDKEPSRNKLRQDWIDKVRLFLCQLKGTRILDFIDISNKVHAISILTPRITTETEQSQIIPRICDGLIRIFYRGGDLSLPELMFQVRPFLDPTERQSSSWDHFCRIELNLRYMWDGEMLIFSFFFL